MIKITNLLYKYYNKYNIKYKKVNTIEFAINL